MFLYNDTATAEIYTLSLHDALPIERRDGQLDERPPTCRVEGERATGGQPPRYHSGHWRCVFTDVPLLQHSSEEPTSELQLRQYLVCRLLLAKKQPPNRRRYTPLMAY